MIKKEDIKKLAELARIEVNEKETKSLAKDIEAILEYVKQVRDVSVQDTVRKDDALVNVFREDANSHESGIYTDALLSAVPERDGQYIKVKKIL